MIYSASLFIVAVFFFPLILSPYCSVPLLSFIANQLLYINKI